VRIFIGQCTQWKAVRLLWHKVIYYPVYSVTVVVTTRCIGRFRITRDFHCTCITQSGFSPHPSSFVTHTVLFFYAPCHFTPLLNLRSLIFSFYALSLFLFFFRTYWSALFLMGDSNFWFTPLLFTPHLTETPPARKKRAGCIRFSTKSFANIA